MISKTVTIKNEQGLHMRPAGVLAKEASKYPCDVKIKSETKEINAKSIMMIIGGGLKCGMEVELVCNGEQEEEAMDSILALFESGFGE